MRARTIPSPKIAVTTPVDDKHIPIIAPFAVKVLGGVCLAFSTN